MNPLSNKTAGFTLLEVMVALLIISFGLLGLAGLQGTALKQNHSAYLRSIATQFSHDIADRIRANRSVNYGAVTPAPHSGCSSACNTTDLAADDMDAWIKAVKAALPTAGTNPTVALNTATGIYTITVSWDDNRSGSANVSFSTSFKP